MLFQCDSTEICWDWAIGNVCVMNIACFPTWPDTVLLKIIGVDERMEVLIKDNVSYVPPDDISLLNEYSSVR